MNTSLSLLHHGRWICTACLAIGLAGCGSDDDKAKKPSDDERQKYFNETSTNWSMFRGYPRGTAYNPYERELNPASVGDLRVLWRTPSASYPIVQTGDRLLASHVAAFAAADGANLWARDDEASSWRSVVCKGSVYQAHDGILGLNVRTGTPTVEIARTAEDGSLLFGVGVAKDSAVIFPVLFQNWSAFAGAQTTTYRVFDAAAKIVSYVRTGFVGLAPASVTGGRIYAPGLSPTSASDGVHWSYSIFSIALDPTAQDPRYRWATRINDDVEAKAPELGVAVINGRVYATGANARELVALDQKSGALLWRTSVDGTVASLAATFDFIYAAGAKSDGSAFVQAFSASNGAPGFSTALGASALSGHLAVAGDVLYTGSSDGNFYAIDARNGSLLKQIALGGQVTDPVVSRGRVFVATGEAIVALGLDSTDAAAPDPSAN